jgi:hypothetical protein
MAILVGSAGSMAMLGSPPPPLLALKLGSAVNTPDAAGMRVALRVMGAAVAGRT